VDRRGEVVADTEGRYRPERRTSSACPSSGRLCRAISLPLRCVWTVRPSTRLRRGPTSSAGPSSPGNPAYGADPRILATLAEVLLLAGGAVVFRPASGLPLGHADRRRHGEPHGLRFRVSERRALPALKPSIVAEFGVLAEELRELGKKVEERGVGPPEAQRGA
jgi:hypothetical protein